MTDIVGLADRAVDELSGGQRQRTWIAMALAQQTDILLLDEPTTFLDITHQVEVLDLLTDLNRQRGTTVVMVLHDLNLAARYADHLVAVADGRVHAAGAPAAVLTTDVVRQCSGSRAACCPTPCRAHRWCCRSAATTWRRRHRRADRSGAAGSATSRRARRARTGDFWRGQSRPRTAASWGPSPPSSTRSPGAGARSSGRSPTLSATVIASSPSGDDIR